MQNFQEVQSAVAAVKAALPHVQPRIAIVLGTGLGDLAHRLEKAVAIPYEDIPHFPHSTVESHAGRLVFGQLEGVDVVLQQGRCHLYEGYTPSAVCMGVRVMQGLGAETLVVTNAAGALNPRWDAGQLMLITDQINFTGRSPLTGANHAGWGECFPDMSCAYDPDYVRTALAAATELGLRVERGVYVGVHGPQLETPAETRMLRTLGADAVGMSTVLEVIAARHMGMNVLGISCLTNKNLPDCMAPAPLEDMLRVAASAGDALSCLIRSFVKKC